MHRNLLTKEIIGSAIEIHKKLGPGLLESVYEECLAFELEQRGFTCLRQLRVPLVYKAVRLDCGYRMDMLVNNTVVVEVKVVDEFHPVHEAQILTYMKISGKDIGLLINFNVLRLKDGVRRFVF